MFRVNMHKVPAFLGCSNIPAMLYVSRLWWRDGREREAQSCESHKSGIIDDRAGIFSGDATR